MRIVDLIEKKVNKKELTKEEIFFLIENYTKEFVPDYQMAAMLMAILFNSMTYKEITYLTLAMLNSGKVYDFSDFDQVLVDKHSTGGIGDKTTLAVVPILASLGVYMPKLSGKGLGQTGGTIDKLESIPGLTTDISIEDFKAQLKEIKCVIAAQSNEIVPADKKLYALRDVTSTVQSIPLIASSIMSKKLATGANIILLDVKCGNGAFMKDLKSAKELAQTMINIGKELGVKVIVEITNMSRPIGKEIGNKNEIIEAINMLSNKGPSDFSKLVFSSCEAILLKMGMVQTEDEARQKIALSIRTYLALNKFYELVRYQGGNVEALNDLKKFWNPKYTYEIKADKDGYLNVFNAFTFGIVSMKLGAGRQTKEDKIDYEAGITLVKQTNEKVSKNEVIFKLHSSNVIDPSLVEELKTAYKIQNNKVQNKIILERMQ
ncbi:pyrimidine-nucleoside phosphorylase [Mycoplasma synoviae GX11-T]|nr:thymidine phosphorylase [Mycoplasmopsis synoviae]MBD5788937.1 pyrimidine-nucleoside phosphorylase [Mycoplasmopsis synoviae GX11-T]